MKFIHQYDFRGNHRLVVNGNAGEWAAYQGIATNGDYRATTDYYGESVHKVIGQEASIEGICRECGKSLPSQHSLEEGCEHVRAAIEAINHSLSPRSR